MHASMNSSHNPEQCIVVVSSVGKTAEFYNLISAFLVKRKGGLVHLVHQVLNISKSIAKEQNRTITGHLHNGDLFECQKASTLTARRS